jgi:hypothetical protein
MTTVNITSLPNIGNLLTSNSILPIVSTVGTATTDKITVGALANYILLQAGNLLPPSQQALTAQTVTNAAQPNITLVGTLTSLSVLGNTIVGNLSTAGTISAAGTTIVGNLSTTGTISAVGNTVVGNVTVNNTLTFSNIAQSGTTPLAATDTTIAFKVPIVINGVTYYIALTAAQ